MAAHSASGSPSHVVFGMLDFGHRRGVESGECGRSERVVLGFTRAITLPRETSEAPDAGRHSSPRRSECSNDEGCGPCARPDQAACGIGSRAGACDRARAGSPRCLRMRSMTGGSMVTAMILSSPPQVGQCSMSISTTRMSSWVRRNGCQAPNRSFTNARLWPSLSAGEAILAARSRCIAEVRSRVTVVTQFGSGAPGPPWVQP